MPRFGIDSVIMRKLLGMGVTLVLCFVMTSLLPAEDKGKNMINPYLDYKPFPEDGRPGDYLDKKITITGKISNVIWQHMFRGPGDKPYIQECYIDPDEHYLYLNQLVGYNIGTFPFDWKLYEPEHLRFYGSFGVVSGSSKRPGKVDETYSEVYFDIVDLEMLPE